MIYVINFVFCKYEKGYNRRFVICREKGSYYHIIKIWVGDGNIKKTLGRRTINSIISTSPTYNISLKKKKERKKKKGKEELLVQC